MKWYKLNPDHTYTPVDIFSKENNFETVDRTVAETTVGDSLVSTVFLGLDHSHSGIRPILFETMVFGGPLGQEQDRYSTWDEAVKGHNEMVERVK